MSISEWSGHKTVIEKINEGEKAAGALSSLTTTAKGSLAAAINEVNAKSDVFYVTFTVTHLDQTQSSGVTCDKTFNEIDNAWRANKKVFARVHTSTGLVANYYELPLTQNNGSSYIAFSGTILSAPTNKEWANIAIDYDLDDRINYYAQFITAE